MASALPKSMQQRQKLPACPVIIFVAVLQDPTQISKPRSFVFFNVKLRSLVLLMHPLRRKTISFCFLWLFKLKKMGLPIKGNGGFFYSIIEEIVLDKHSGYGRWRNWECSLEFQTVKKERTL